MRNFYPIAVVLLACFASTACSTLRNTLNPPLEETETAAQRRQRISVIDGEQLRVSKAWASCRESVKVALDAPHEARTSWGYDDERVTATESTPSNPHYRFIAYVDIQLGNETVQRRSFDCTVRYRQSDNYDVVRLTFSA
jgi:hypothetical protein